MAVLLLIALIGIGGIGSCTGHRDDGTERPALQRQTAPPTTEPRRHSPEFPGGGAAMPPGASAPSQ